MAGKRKSVLPSAEGNGSQPFHFHDKGFAEEWPGLFEFLATATDNEKERKGGSVSLFADRGRLKACFTDRQTQLMFYADLNPALGLQGQLEAILTGEHEAWQPTKKNPGKPVF